MIWSRPVERWRTPTGGLLARFRAWFIFRVVGHDSEICDRCGGRVGEVWWCQDEEVWRRAYLSATGRVSMSWQGEACGGLLCSRCFERHSGVRIMWLAQTGDEFDRVVTESFSRRVS